MRIVTVFTKAGCPQCALTQRALTNAGIAFQTADVAEGPTAAANYETVQTLGYTSLPVVTVSEQSNHGSIDQHWAGFQPGKITALATVEA